MPDQPRSNLDEFLDGQLADAARAEFERAMRSDPTLSEAVRLQRDIDASLARLFAPSAGEAPALRFPARRQIPMYWGAAAAVLLAAIVGAYFLVRGSGGGGATLASVYHSEVSAGFVPKVVCTTEPEFAAWVQKYFGQPLYPAKAHDGVEFVGWDYAPIVTKRSGVLLAKVDNQPVIVIVDRADKEARPAPEAKEGLQTFRQQIGSLVLYEVTPLPRPAILPLLSTSKPAGG